MNELLLHFAIRRVYLDYPWLSQHACGSCPSVEADEIALALNWFAEDGPPLDFRRSTYSLKRSVEDASGLHVGERAFAIAAVVVGHGLRRRAGSIFLV